MSFFFFLSYRWVNISVCLPHPYLFFSWSSLLLAVTSKFSFFYFISIFIRSIFSLPNPAPNLSLHHHSSPTSASCSPAWLLHPAAFFSSPLAPLSHVPVRGRGSTMLYLSKAHLVPFLPRPPPFIRPAFPSSFRFLFFFHFLSFSRKYIYTSSLSLRLYPLSLSHIHFNTTHSSHSSCLVSLHLTTWLFEDSSHKPYSQSTPLTLDLYCLIMKASLAQIDNVYIMHMNNSDHQRSNHTTGLGERDNNYYSVSTKCNLNTEHTR